MILKLYKLKKQKTFLIKIYILEESSINKTRFSNPRKSASIRSLNNLVNPCKC